MKITIQQIEICAYDVHYLPLNCKLSIATCVVVVSYIFKMHHPQDSFAKLILFKQCEFNNRQFLVTVETIKSLPGVAGLHEHLTLMTLCKSFRNLEYIY